MSIEGEKEENQSIREGGPEIFFQRHSKALYRSDDEIARSNDPTRGVNPENQLTPDLSEEGIRFAKEQAEQFFLNLDSKRDKICVVSSKRARALETARIYIDVAKERGFTIVQSNRDEGELAEGIGKGEIRVLDRLSLRPLSVLFDYAFYPDSMMPELNWEAVSSEDKEKWSKIHSIIIANDKGSWGANFHAHASELKKLFPELKIEDYEDLYNKQFLNLVRLGKWITKRAKTNDPEGSTKILAFGHENYVGFALDKYFGDHAIANCETLTFTPDDKGNLVFGRRGQQATI